MKSRRSKVKYNNFRGTQQRALLQNFAPGGKLNPAPAGTDLKLAVMETELKALKDMVTELRQARDDWKAQAGHLVLAARPITARAPADTPSAPASAPTAAPEPERPTSWIPRRVTACAFHGIGLFRGATKKPGSGAHTPSRRALGG